MTDKPPIHAGMSREEYERAVSQKDKAMSNEGVEVKKLPRVGDWVTIRAQVDWVGFATFTLVGVRGEQQFAPDQIISIEPRPIAVGDRVRAGKIVGTVEWVDLERALVRVTEFDHDIHTSWINEIQAAGNLVLESLSALTPAGASDE